MKLLCSVIKKKDFEVIRDPLTLKWGYLKSIGVKIQRFDYLDKYNFENSDHSRSLDPELG